MSTMTTATSCSGQARAGYVNWLRWNGNCKINAVRSFTKGCDLRTQGDLFWDNYYVGGLTSANTNWALVSSTYVQYYVYSGANATGSTRLVSGNIGPHLSRSIVQANNFC